jgi:hypothetical protein
VNSTVCYRVVRAAKRMGLYEVEVNFDGLERPDSEAIILTKRIDQHQRVVPSGLIQEFEFAYFRGCHYNILELSIRFDSSPQPDSCDMYLTLVERSGW